MWSVIGALARGTAAAGDDRGDLPDGRASTRRSSPRRRRPARCCPTGGSGSASAPARRSTSTSSATAGRPPTCGWRCSRRRSRSSARLWTGEQRQPRRRALHGGERPDLHAAGRAAADPTSRLRPEGDRAGGPDRRRVRDHAAGRGRCVEQLPRARGGDGARSHGGRQGVLGAGPRTRRARPRTGCGPTRACRASCPRCCRRPRTSSRRAQLVDARTRSPSDALRARRRPARRAARQYVDAGFDEVYVSQVGPFSQDLLRRLPEDGASRVAQASLLTGPSSVITRERVVRHHPKGRDHQACSSPRPGSVAAHG